MPKTQLQTQLPSGYKWLLIIFIIISTILIIILYCGMYIQYKQINEINDDIMQDK